MREKRNHYAIARLSDSEYELFLNLMRQEGFNNMSRFIRRKLLEQGRVKRRSVTGGSDVSGQVAMLRGDIRRIGVNYNQKVKALNSLSRLRDGYGRAVMTEEVVAKYLADMKLMMEHLLEKVYDIEKCVGDYVGDSGNNSPDGETI